MVARSDTCYQRANRSGCDRWFCRPGLQRDSWRKKRRQRRGRGAASDVGRGLSKLRGCRRNALGTLFYACALTSAGRTWINLANNHRGSKVQMSGEASECSRGTCFRSWRRSRPPSFANGSLICGYRAESFRFCGRAVQNEKRRRIPGTYESRRDGSLHRKRGEAVSFLMESWK
jgi:hypothetical protein